LGGGITWKVNGQDVTADSMSDIDFGVATNTDRIPIDIINNVTGERITMQISLTYDGEFGFTAVLSINLEPKNAGLYANLFYYHPQNQQLEFMTYGKIAEDGTVELTFTHASDYAIVIDAKPLDGSADETPTESDSNSNSSNNSSDSNSNNSSNSNNNSSDSNNSNSSNNSSDSNNSNSSSDNNNSSNSIDSNNNNNNNDNNSNTSDTGKEDHQTETNTPQTGDPNDLTAWFLALLASLGGMVALGVSKKKKKCSDN
jgi:hypothetical protein